MFVQYRPSYELREFDRLYRELEDIYHSLAIRSGLSDSAFVIFYFIMEYGEGCLQKEISDRYSISPQTVNSSVRNLEKKGYLYLKQGKKRDMHIYLTDAGKQILEKRLNPVVELENSVFQAMPSNEIQELLRLTRKYLELYREKLNTLSSEVEHRNAPSDSLSEPAG